MSLPHAVAVGDHEVRSVGLNWFSDVAEAVGSVPRHRQLEPTSQVRYPDLLAATKNNNKTV